MAITKQLIRDWLPPAINHWIGQLRGQSIRFKGEFATWEEACQLSNGYDAQDILAQVLAATKKVQRGEAAFERDSVLFEKIEYDWPVLAGLLWASSRNGGQLNVLDFGGALGSSYYQHLNILQSIPDIHWNVVEQAHYFQAGKTNFQDEKLRFYPSIDSCLVENRPNVVLLSGVLQYLQDPLALFKSTLILGADLIILDRTIINHTTSNKIYVQLVPATIYKASYPCHSLSEQQLLSTAAAEQYLLTSDFNSLEFNALKSISSDFKGYIFERVE